MNRLVMFIAMTIGGYVGWWAAEATGFGLMGAFIISSFGSLVGIYLAWRVLKDCLD